MLAVPSPNFAAPRCPAAKPAIGVQLSPPRFPRPFTPALVAAAVCPTRASVFHALIYIHLAVYRRVGALRAPTNVASRSKVLIKPIFSFFATVL